MFLYYAALSSSGGIECWGRNQYDQVLDAPTSELGYLSVSVGYYHSCALDTAGAIECWAHDALDQVSGAP